MDSCPRSGRSRRRYPDRMRPKTFTTDQLNPLGNVVDWYGPRLIWNPNMFMRLLVADLTSVSLKTQSNFNSSAGIKVPESAI
jgi:hypothetical protein